MITRLLQSFEFESPGDLVRSLFPGLKYHLSVDISMIAFLLSALEYLLGVSGFAAVLFVLAMFAEVLTGIKASNEPLSSVKFSRFSIKVACYILIIAASYHLHTSFDAKGLELASSAFQWLYLYLMIHVFGENAVSIMENVATIEGKPKSYYISKIKARFKKLI